MNLRRLTDDFAAAVTAMEMAWVLYRSKRENMRLLSRYVRCLRRCRRLRGELTHLLETGTL